MIHEMRYFFHAGALPTWHASILQLQLWSNDPATLYLSLVVLQLHGTSCSLERGHLPWLRGKLYPGIVSTFSLHKHYALPSPGKTCRQETSVHPPPNPAKCLTTRSFNPLGQQIHHHNGRWIRHRPSPPPAPLRPPAHVLLSSTCPSLRARRSLPS
jgi:hypothetical protein